MKKRANCPRGKQQFCLFLVVENIEDQEKDVVLEDGSSLLMCSGGNILASSGH